MLISQVPEEGGSGPSRECPNTMEIPPEYRSAGDLFDFMAKSQNVQSSYEYKSASELFDLMAKNQNFQPDEDESLTTRDLILIYKNIDLGTKLMNNANEIKRKAPNQYVETIVYEDLESDSDLSEIYSSEDIHNVVLINKERIDLLNKTPPLESTVCPKFGNSDIDMPSLTDFGKTVTYKERYEQLKNLNLITKSDEFISPVIPASLLDYICCKSLEDNYNFYMDNIIRYVKSTIDQLKRISNGDFLTDKAKEKWREVNEGNEIVSSDMKTSKVLANSTSIPLYVERKITGHVTKWDDLVHSEVDIRSLSKILEKRIVVEVPKTICGSYKLFSKCCNDNIIISCKRDIPATIPEEQEESRVDVVVKLSRSDSGHVISNISSIMILQKDPENATDTLPSLPYKGDQGICVDVPQDFENQSLTVTELSDNHASDSSNEDFKLLEENEDHIPYKTCNDSTVEASNEYSADTRPEYQEASGSDHNLYLMNKFAVGENANNANKTASDQLRVTVQRLNMQTLPEEVFEDASSFITTNLKKSSARKRIKSPYENKSYALEEKKRKKLLEIKQKREKRKLALSESKVNKHKNTKGTLVPHTSSSVTKLPITNKFFYNSIYGKSVTADLDNDQCKIKGQRPKKEHIPEISLEDDSQENSPPPKSNIDMNKAQKYINKTYYLDEAETEIMYMELKRKTDCDLQDTTLGSNSAVSNDFIGISGKVEALGELIRNEEQKKKKNLVDNIFTPYTGERSAPTNTPKSEDNAKPPQHNDVEPKKISTSAEFRKSIDKMYELIKSLGKNDGGETKLCKSKFTAVTSIPEINGNAGGESSTVQNSDSGTSFKHQTSSNPSCLSFEKAPISEAATTISTIPGIQEPSTVVPKVIISTKLKVLKEEREKSKERKDRKKCNSASKSISTESPFKSISQLLYEFESVQKVRSKSVAETKLNKKPEIGSSEPKTDTHQTARKNVKQETRLKDNDSVPERHRGFSLNRDRKPKPPHALEVSKYLHQANQPESKTVNRIIRKKVVDIVDEMKEARGEAVRGPKPNARLNSLAQPKRTYVQAQIEEFQARYGKSIVTDRLQRLSVPSGYISDRNASPKPRKKNGTDSGSLASRYSPSPPTVLERSTKKPSCNNSLTTGSPSVNDQSFKQCNGDAPDALKKKMVAVESYLNNHYGQPSQALNSSNLLQDGHKSRIPLFPTDLELSSVSSSLMDESTTIGNKIHHIIDNMICKSPPFTIMSQYRRSETATNVSTEPKFKEDIALIEPNSPDSVYSYHFIPMEHNKQSKCLKREETIPEETELSQDNESGIEALSLQSRNSATELEKLENALCRRMSIGKFSKRLRLKNLTLAPKESVQQVVLLQSGDNSNSLVVKSTISQNIKINAKNDADLKTLSELTNISNIDWALSKFPMQIATVGYSFPFHNVEIDSTINFKRISDENIDMKKVLESKFDKTIQCFKGEHDEPLPQNEVQVDLKEVIANIVTTISSTLIEKQLDQKDAKDNEAKQICLENKEEFDSNLITDHLHMNSTEISSSKSQENSPQTPTISKVPSREISPQIPTISKVPSSENSITKPKLTAINVGNKSVECVSQKSSRIEYTTSLDILAGLLNEIQNITTRQTEIATKSDYESDKDAKELKTILKNASEKESTQDNCNIISITSLDKLKKFESKPSMFSLYNISNNTDRDSLKPMYEHKEVNAVAPEREFVNRCTDVPSCLFPITITQSTNMTNSLLGIISKPSSQSSFAFDEHPLHYNASLTSLTTFIKHPKDERIDSQTKTGIKVVDLELDDMSYRKFIEKKSTEIVDCQKLTIQKNTGNNNKYYNIDTDFDPIMKMKRDILVTVYSVLVLTVFAALSFPEILYRA